jgi:hypothetical protein
VGIIDPRDQDRDPAAAPDPDDDLHPLELPEEDQLIYDLSGWSLGLRSAAVEALAVAGIPHAWSGTDLVMHVRHETMADAVLEAVERQGRAEGEEIVDPDRPAAEDGGRPSVVRSGEEIEYDLTDWSPAERAAIDDDLQRMEIAYRWEGDLLVVPGDREQEIDGLLDRLEVSIDEAGVESPLAELFLVVDALETKPNDRDTVLELNVALERAEAAPLPYGMSPDAWDQLLDGVSDLLDQALESDSGDDVRQAASALRERLRPYV